MKLKIMFVDDEKNVLSSLKRQFYNKKDEWDMYFVNSGDEAIKKINEEEFDVVISDMYMPKMDGAELLEYIQDDSPITIRYILSGYSDIDLVKRTLKPAHKFFHKPCSKEKIEHAINRVMFLKKLLPDKEIREKINQIGMLPTNPVSYSILSEGVAKSDMNFFKNSLYFDVAMFLNLYKIIMNSFFMDVDEGHSFFKLLHHIDKTILDRVIASQDIFVNYEDILLKDFSFNEVWRHSRRVAYLCKAIFERINKNVSMIEDSFIGGLLHDVGVYLMFLIFKDEYLKFLKEHFYYQDFSVKEKEKFGYTHSVLGGYLVGLWGANLDIVASIAFHDRPSAIKNKKLSVLSIVHFSGIFDKNKVNCVTNHSELSLDTKHYFQLVTPSDLKIWRMICEAKYNLFNDKVNEIYL